jgi:hypothetical protein
MAQLFVQFKQFELQFEVLCTQDSSRTEEYFVQLTLFSDQFSQVLRSLRSVNFDSAPVIAKNSQILMELHQALNYSNYPEAFSLTLKTRVEKVTEQLSLLELLYNKLSTRDG